MERGQVEDMKIEIVQMDYNEEDRKKTKGFDYNKEIEFILTHERRNEILAKMAKTLKGNTLLVFQRIEHGKRLMELIGEPEGKQVLYVAGETDKDSREAARQIAERDDVIIVASLGVFSTGINIKNLHNLIFAHPTKSKIKVLQSIGRILRKSDSGQQAVVFDIVDDLKHGSRDNFALRHASERFKQYTNENFTFKIRQIKL